MKATIAARVQALRGMTVAELREQYREVFREEPRSHHREQLWRAVAWRMQANEEGDLSQRARRLAQELARDADIRVLPPRGYTPDGPADPARTVSRAFPGARGPRMPLPGAILVRPYKDREIRVTVLERGFDWEGQVYRSLSAVARAVTGSHWNGHHFFGLRGRGVRRGTR